MSEDQLADQRTDFGTWDDAERLRQWAFLQRSAQQRLDRLVQALKRAYQSGALRPRRVTGP